MAENDDTTSENTEKDTTVSPSKIEVNTDAKPAELSIEEQIQKGIDAALAPMKENLENAYKARDEAIETKKKLEEEARKNELARLEAEGKHQEKLQAELEHERQRAEKLEQTNTELTRNLSIRNALSAYDFRNTTASDMAFNSIASQLVRNEQGEWVHSTGVSIVEATKSFLESSDNSFLLKPKVSSGSDTNTDITPSPGTSRPKSLFDMPQSDVIKMAGEGKLRKK